MSDQVTYAALTFQDPTGARNNRDGNNLRKRGLLAPTPRWRQATLGLLMLCLMLLTGLVTFGMMFLQMSNEINSDSENLSRLQKIFHQQQDNLSQQLSNCSKVPLEQEFLKSQITGLLQRQEQMATKLCKELVTHTSDHKCNPCPKTWQWYQDSCYHFIVGEEKSWSNSGKDCADKNSTLVKIDSMKEKVFLQSQPLPSLAFFWLGLSRSSSHRRWLWEDGSILSPSIFTNDELTQMNGSQGCAYLQRGNIYVSRCSAEISWICEKTAGLVKIEDLD